MYLFHGTNLKNLKSILEDNYLKSSALLLKEGHSKTILNEGYGIYKENNFVYFSCCEKLFDKRIFNPIILYFDSKLLYDKTFYVSTVYSPAPECLGEWRIPSESDMEYKRKYKKHYKLYNLVLQKLYDNSIGKIKGGKAFQAFQQIAIKSKISLDNLIAIEFKITKNNKINKIIDYINTYYPHIIIKYI
jgi:hypothetical protein